MKKQTNAMQLAVTGLLAALVFVSSMISIPIPLPAGPATRIHLGNIFCLLSGFILGPVFGGLSAGIGSFFFDLLNPQYIADSPFTFCFKFLMAFLCGKLARSGGKNTMDIKLNFLAAAVGQLAYIVLYAGKGFVENLLMRMELVPALAILGTKIAASLTNGLIAVVLSVPLYFVIRKALQSNRLLEKINL